MAPYLHLRIGDYHLFSGNFTEAIAAYEIYRKQLPNDEFACNKLGFAYFRSGQYEKAVDMFQRALTLNPAFSKARENLEAARARTR
jgi:tetratricopeptide (TPR) repeat protein